MRVLLTAESWIDASRFGILVRRSLLPCSDVCQSYLWGGAGINRGCLNSCVCSAPSLWDMCALLCICFLSLSPYVFIDTCTFHMYSDMKWHKMTSDAFHHQLTWHWWHFSLEYTTTRQSAPSHNIWLSHCNQLPHTTLELPSPDPDTDLSSF